MPSTHSPPHITLALSAAGIVAVASGQKYPWAQTALEQAGFHRRADGTYALPLRDPESGRAALTDLVRTAHRHHSAVTTSNRRYLGDVADAIAEHLPGTWSATVDVYSHPVWQEDLVPWLWDCGELSRAVRSERIPYAAVLSDGAGIELLFVERPGHHHGYLIGAFASEGFNNNDNEPHAPRSIVVPAEPELAARAISARVLPGYHRAVHARRLATVTAALARLREEYETWQAIVASGRYSDGVPIDPRNLPDLESGFADYAWHAFRGILLHAPALLKQCRPADAAWPQDAAALNRLQHTVEMATPVLTDWNTQVKGAWQKPGALPAQTYTDAKTRRDAQVRPAIETWLADGDTLIRQARAAAPNPHTALPAQEPGTAAVATVLPPCPGASPRR
ncbi:hypothetical protein OG607_41190 [Streptomyces sp. NBC_01537]|uniref:hypothetical protein n=1 Tax=Streptomyces sp. NBC_01537 TaxID=2903896 RepID=UPI003863AE69